MFGGRIGPEKGTTTWRFRELNVLKNQKGTQGGWSAVSNMPGEVRDIPCWPWLRYNILFQVRSNLGF
jgi:hypothetical protein